jgi:hemicentin
MQTTTRERDLGKDWASGHYQVAVLPPSMEKLKWAFGSLTLSQEKEFIYRRIEALSDSTSSFLRASLTEVVAESHEAMRKFAERNILAGMLRTQHARTDATGLEREAHLRARSVVSLRDIQRVFSLFKFFYHDATTETGKQGRTESEQRRRAMLLAVAAVYYLRLDAQSRIDFLHLINALPTESGQDMKLFDVLNEAIDTVINAIEIPTGIAVTRGLRENIFLTVVCSVSQTPLMIVGPPGSSKVSFTN